MKRSSALILGGLFASATLLYLLYRSVRLASAALVENAQKALNFLAWRDQVLESYDPPQKGTTGAPPATKVQAPRADALVVHGNSMAAVPLGAADLFVDVLYPAGCRTVLLTGGVGRETPPLWAELAERNMTSIFAVEPWPQNRPPAQVSLPSQGVTKPVLAHVDLALAPEKLREYASEADVFLEIFVSRCRERGLKVSFGGNPMAEDIASPAAATATEGTGAGAEARVYVETASTHTGTNVEFSRASLRKLGCGEQPALVVVQQPALQLRTCLTWEKQTGVLPLGWTVRPTESACGRPGSEMLQYALGELRRIPKYAAEDMGFCTMPEDFPEDLLASLEALEPAINAAVALEKDKRARGG